MQEIKNVVEKHFKANYDKEDYRLYEVNTYKHSIEYIIIENISGVIVNFHVSEHGVFTASSKESLLESEHEVSAWLNFIQGIKYELRGMR